MMRLSSMRHAELAFGIALSVLLVSPGSAQELTGTLKKIRDAGTVTIGHRESSVPFSYYDDQKKVVGYSMDLCMKIVDAVKAKLRLDKLEVKFTPVTPTTRISMVANGEVDLECGSTTNTIDRQKQVSFTVTHFVTSNRFVAKNTNNLKTVDNLKNKIVVSTTGSTSIKLISDINARKTLSMNIVPAKDYADAFQMVETDKADAFVMDDILLYSFVANSKTPSDYGISSEALSVEPYGIMLRRDDDTFKAVANAELVRIYSSGEINDIYKKWFQSPVPPKGVNLNLPMSNAFKAVVSKPTDSGDPAAY